MKIMPINNLNTQNTQFRAKFPKRDINEFLREATVEDAIDEIPQLYTMLDVIKNHPGKTAEIEHSGIWHKILIDGKSINNDKKYFCAMHALKDAIVKGKSTLMQNSPLKRITDEEFENAYFKNSKKTINDIENLFEE